MTTLSASYSSKTSTGLGNKIGVALRNLFVSFVKAHEGNWHPRESEVGALAGLTPRCHAICSYDPKAQLNRLANEVESSQPNLATELRFIAGRG